MKEFGIKISIVGAIISILGSVNYYAFKILTVLKVIDISKQILNDISFYPTCAGLGLISLGMALILKFNKTRILLRYFLTGSASFWGLQLIVWSINDFIYQFDDRNLIAYMSSLSSGVLICTIIYFLYRHR